MPRAKQRFTESQIRYTKMILEAPGLKTNLARELGVTRQAVSDWPVVPITRLADVERITGIPRERLRPDIFDRPRRR